MAMVAPSNSSSPSPADHSSSCSKSEARKTRGAGVCKRSVLKRAEKDLKPEFQMSIGNGLPTVETPMDRRLRAISGLLSVLIAGQDRILAKADATSTGCGFEDEPTKVTNSNIASSNLEEAPENELASPLISVNFNQDETGPSPNDLAFSEPKSTTPQEGADSITPLPPSNNEAHALSNKVILSEDCETHENGQKQNSGLENEFTELTMGSHGCRTEASASTSQSEARKEETENPGFADGDESCSVEGGFSSIVGSSAAKDALLEAVILPLRLGQLAGPGGLPLFSGLRQAGHVLLHGPPGTGKTTLAAAAVTT